MIDFINDFLKFELLQRAAIVGILVALCCSLLGVSLVLKRYSMIGDGLSHVAFGALSIAFALNAAPLMVTIPVVVIAAFFLLRISENSKIKGDSAIALIASTSLAIGVVSAKLSGGVNIDVNSYMFGNILLLTKNDLLFCIPLAIIVIAVYILYYNAIFAITFDESFSAASGSKVSVYKTMLAILTALVVVVGMRIMGTLLISSLIIFPGQSSMRYFKSYKSVTVCSAVISVVCFAIGLIVTYATDIPIGAGIVLVNAICFCIFFVVGKLARRS